MPLYPDLTACGISFMHFAFHVGSGLAEIDAFWRQRGVDEKDAQNRVLFASYTRARQPHTVWIQWVRSHDECCDVFLGLEARRPSEVWPKLPNTGSRLREKDLREFLNLLRSLEVHLGVRSRYGFPWEKSLDSILPLPPHIRPASLVLDVFGPEGGTSGNRAQKRVMTVTYQRFGKSWLSIVEPEGRFQIGDTEVTDQFFKVPYETACLLAKSINRLEPI